MSDRLSAVLMKEPGRSAIGTESPGAAAKVVVPHTDYTQYTKGHLAEVVGNITRLHSDFSTIPDADTALTEVIDARWDEISGTDQEKKFNVALLAKIGIQYPGSDAQPGNSPRYLDLSRNGQLYTAHITDIVRNFSSNGGIFDRVAFAESVIVTSMRLAAPNTHPDAISGLVNTVYLMREAGIINGSTIHNIEMGIDGTARHIAIKLLHSGKELTDDQRKIIEVFSKKLTDFSLKYFGAESIFKAQKNPQSPTSLVADVSTVQNFVRKYLPYTASQFSEEGVTEVSGQKPTIPELPEGIETNIELKPDNDWHMRGYTINIHGSAGEQIGNVSGLVRQNHFTITDANLEATYRGKGIARAAYERLIEDAFNHGFTVSSDSKVTDAAVKVYESLGRRGYNIIKNPLVERGEYDRWTTPDGSPVFTIKKK